MPDPISILPPPPQVTIPPHHISNNSGGTHPLQVGHTSHGIKQETGVRPSGSATHVQSAWNHTLEAHMPTPTAGIKQLQKPRNREKLVP